MYSCDFVVMQTTCRQAHNPITLSSNNVFLECSCGAQVLLASMCGAGYSLLGAVALLCELAELHDVLNTVVAECAICSGECERCPAAEYITL